VAGQHLLQQRRGQLTETDGIHVKTSTPVAEAGIVIGRKPTINGCHY